jgi:hypothetical protein
MPFIDGDHKQPLHSGLEYRPPVEHANLYYRQINQRQQPLPEESALHLTRFGSVEAGQAHRRR